MTAAASPFQRSAIEQAVHEAVERGGAFAAWPPVLRRAYFERNGESIRQELFQQQLVGLAVTVLSILLDAVALPEYLARGLALRAVLVVAPAIVLLLLARRLPLRILKLGMASCLIAFAAVATHLAGFAEPATAARYTMATTLLFAMAVMLLPFLREELAGFAAGFVAATLLVSLWPAPLPLTQWLEHAILTVLVGGGALVIAIRNGEQRQRNFLYDLRDRFTHAELEYNLAVLRELSESDALTGLANRRAFRSVFDSAFRNGARAGGGSVSVMMIDLDHFKRFNDEYGHQAGDRALRSVARALEECFAGTDGIVARFGGEEFIGAFPSRTLAEASAFAEIVRSKIAGVEVRVRENEARQLSASIGIASSGPGAEIDLAELTARADRALYRAKDEGRDRVVVSERIELRVDRIAS
ncbi:GGDEF domain-containing protein [Parerythrobacter aurantius]|uniref:GGDEF domain-containing protein n=1 Tax=Parerythrobacter aurantius TaxID=3127706 RepID=UPI0032498B63